MQNVIRFGAFTFNKDAGELIHCDASGQETLTRLQPQPTRLLQLLLDHYPAIVSREQIRAAIWPEVQVDYEGSIHFCIRQIRAALNDQAAHPQFIETIPRRGYRWIAECTKEEVRPKTINQSAGNRSGYARVLSFYKIAIIGMALLLLAFTAVYFLTRSGPTAVKSVTRIAIMPFQPEEPDNTFTGNDIALRLVDQLANADQDNLEIIGPTTTAQYSPPEIREMIKQLRIDYVINGKFSMRSDTSRLLAEVIRATDGAHVWVRSFEDGVVWDSIVVQIGAGVLGSFR